MQSTAFHKVALVEDERLPWWQSSFIVGFDEGEAGEGGAEGDPGEGGEEGEGGEGGEPDESGLPDNIKAILKKERDLRTAAEKKARILEKNAQAASKAGAKSTAKTDDKSEGEGSGAKVDASTQTKMEKLIVGFRTTALRSIVETLAKDFQDPTDVFAHLDTSSFDYTQDEDDPTNVVFDEAEIRTAIKDLAKRKSYLLKPAGEGQGTKAKPVSGPKFAGRGSGKQTTGLSQQEMANRFPAMRTAIRAGNNKSE